MLFTPHKSVQHRAQHRKNPQTPITLGRTRYAAEQRKDQVALQAPGNGRAGALTALAVKRRALRPELTHHLRYSNVRLQSID